MTDEEGNHFYYDYNAFDQLIQSTTAEGIVQSMQYDATNNMTASSATIVGGSADSSMTYDVLDQLVGMNVEQSATSTQQYQWTYHPHELIASTTAPNGLQTSYEYDHNDLVKVVRITDGTITKEYYYTYNINGELIKVVAPNGAETFWVRDDLGRVITMIDDHGTKTHIMYNQQNLPIQVKIKDNTGTTLKKTEYDYNSVGWVLRKRDYTKEGTRWSQAGGASITYLHSTPDVYETNYTYNKVGQMKTSVNPRGATTSMFYDNKGRLFKVVDSLGNSTFYDYDGRDLVTSMRLIAASGGTYQNDYRYDSDGRLVLTTNNDGKHKAYTYNTLNQVTSVIDENGNRTDMTYDYAGNVLTSTQYLQGNGNNSTAVTTRYEYDIMNNLIALTDTEGNRSEFTYDTFNRMTQEIYPDGKRNLFTYDIMDNVLSTTDPNGSVVTNGYDNLNRLV